MNYWFYSIIIISVAFWIWNNLLTILSSRKPKELPLEVADVYEPEQYEKSENYRKEKRQFSILTSTIDLTLFLTFFILGGFAWLDNSLRNFVIQLSTGEIPSFLIDYEILLGLLYIGSLLVVSQLIHLPFSLYATFVIEAKYGFNKTTLKTFIKDRILGAILAVVLGVPILGIILWIFSFAAQNPFSWLYVWSAVFIIQLLLFYIAPVWIMPLFNKFEPLEDGELKSAIENFARKENFQLTGIFKMDGSKRSTKANAFFTGFGKNKRIVLFDTLINSMSTEELVAILAHEMGHCKKRHLSKSFILGAISMAITFFLIQQLINNVSLFEAFQVEELSVYASLVFIAPLLEPLNYFLEIISNCLSRKHEYEADHYAATSYGHPEKLISALKTLSRDNLSNLTPHPLEVFTEYSHPPLKERIAALNAAK